MSTDRQTYSTEKQIAAIAAYAARKNIIIVKTYKDDGKSGLLLDRRTALKSLLGDVMLGKADFDFILVYDVSRWAASKIATKARIASSFVRRLVSGSNIVRRSFQTTIA